MTFPTNTFLSPPAHLIMFLMMLQRKRVVAYGEAESPGGPGVAELVQLTGRLITFIARLAWSD